MGISYFDVWKKRMINDGGDIIQSRLNTSKDFFNRNFKDDPSYKLAILKKKNQIISDLDLDTRIVNIDTDTTKKKIYVRPDTNIEVGDYVVYPNKTYLVLEVEDNLISPYGDCKECNHLFKWMYKGVLHTAYGIGTNQTKNILGIDSIQAGIIESDSRYNIQMSNNDNTKTIKVGQRFLFNDGAWKVTQIEYISTKDCIRSILLGQDSINTEIDDVDNEIAGASINKHTYTYDIPTNFEVSKDNTYNLVFSIKDENGKDFDYSLVTVTTTNNTLVQVSNTNGVISVKGLAVGSGTIKLSVPIGSTSKDFDILFEVKEVVADKIEYKYDFKQGTAIKQYVTDLVTITRLINGVQDNTLKVNYSFDSNAQSLIDSKKIIVTKVSDLSFNIKNALITVPTTIYLTVNDVDKGTKVLDNFPLVLTSGL
jgi:hypothetical protein